jgi:hypothetical protein
VELKAPNLIEKFVEDFLQDIRDGYFKHPECEF